MFRILIADDHAVVRGGLKQIMGTTQDIAVAEEAVDGKDLLAKLRVGDFDLLLLDMTMPGLSGIDLIRRVRAEKPNLPILVLSMHNEGQVVTRALNAGAAGYVTKDSDPDILVAAVRKVAQGGRFIDPALVDTIVFKIGTMDTAPHEVLSDREFEVMRLLAGGIGIAEIGEKLNVSGKTVSTHKMRLMQKLGLSNNAELVKYALRHGIVQP